MFLKPTYFSIFLTLFACNLREKATDSNLNGSLLSPNSASSFRQRTPGEMSALAAKLAGRTKFTAAVSRSQRSENLRTQLFALINEESGIPPAQTAEIVKKVISGEAGQCDQHACSEVTSLSTKDVDNFLIESEEMAAIRKAPSFKERYFLTNSLMEQKPFQKLLIAREAVWFDKNDFYNITTGEAYEKISKQNSDNTFANLMKTGPLTADEKKVMAFLEENLPVYIYHATSTDRTNAILESKAILSPKKGNLPKQGTRVQLVEDELFSSSEYVFFRMSFIKPDRSFMRQYGDVVFYLNSDSKSLDEMTKVGAWGSNNSGNAFIQDHTGVRIPTSFMGIPPDREKLEKVLKIYLESAKKSSVKAEFSKKLVTPNHFKREMILRAIQVSRNRKDIYKQVQRLSENINDDSTPARRREIASIIISEYLSNNGCYYSGDIEIHFPGSVSYRWIQAIGVARHFRDEIIQNNIQQQLPGFMFMFDFNKNHGQPEYDEEGLKMMLGKQAS
jgi:hypothetical protein